MTNRAAVESLTRQLLLAQVVGVSALIGTSKDTSAPGRWSPRRLLLLWSRNPFRATTTSLRSEMSFLRFLIRNS